MPTGLARVSPLPFPTRRPTRAAVDWRILGDLLQQIAAEGDQDFLSLETTRAQRRLRLLQSVKPKD